MAGTSYTRQSTITDGETITAALFNDEYNTLLGAFSYAASGTTGHRHDATAGEGGNIHIIGDQDFLNKIVVDSTNNRWGVFVQVSSSAVEQIRIQDGAIVPVTDNDIDLGTASLEFKDLYIDGTANIDTLVVTGAVTGSSTIQGTTITATTAFVPDASDGAALGTSALEFSDLFLADGAVINFGDDQDVSLTHVVDTGLLLSSTDQLQFGDSGTYIYQSADGVLDLVSDTEIELTATTIDINGAVAMDGAITGGTNITISGELDAATLDISGDADIDGTLEADAITIAGVSLAETISDTVGAMVTSNTESGITVAYVDVDNTLDFTVGTLNQDTTGTAALATTVTVSANNTTDETVYPVFVDGATGTQGAETDTGLTYNPSSGLLTAAEVSATTLDIGGTNITSTAAELNILDGVTATAAEINVLDGITATVAELNYTDGVTSNIQTQIDALQDLDADLTAIAALTPTDGNFIVGNGSAWVAESGNTVLASVGVTATSTELNILDGVTATAAELNILDGVTSTAAELNILDGVTSTFTELNLLDGVTATTAELNYVDGVTSNIQTQIDALQDADADLTAIGALAKTDGNFIVGNGSTWVAEAGATVLASIGVTATLAEVNIMDGVTATTAELNILDGVTSTFTELNLLDGVTSTTAELNILDGVTSTAAELNILDGVTSTAAELNILDGVTSTAAELNYLDLATLGTSAASKAVTADANNVVTFTSGIYEEFLAVTSSSAATTINLRLGTNFLHDLTEATTFTFSNPAASGLASTFTLKIIQDSTARAITWPSAVDWAAATAPTLTATDNGVDYFVFTTNDGGTTWYGFTAGQAMA